MVVVIPGASELRSVGGWLGFRTVVEAYRWTRVTVQDRVRARARVKAKARDGEGGYFLRLHTAFCIVE